MAKKKIRLGINGYGRIGRCVHRIALESDDIEVVATASRGDAACRAHLLQYDSLYGPLRYKIEAKDDHFLVDSKRIESITGKPGIDFMWSDYDVDIVLESTGVFRTREGMECHLRGGAKKVILSSPPKDDIVPVYVIGVNADKYAGEAIVSNASCTTNCLAPVAKVLHEKFGIESAHLTTVHAVTGDQNILDNTHQHLRRARSFIPSIIPCRTGVSAALEKIMPEIAQNFTGQALRVPVPVVSMIDLAANLKKETTVEEVNESLQAAGKESGLIGVSHNPLVSIDFKGDSRSAIVEADSTKVLNGKFLKLLAWYDNEWGYSCRVADLIRVVAK